MSNMFLMLQRMAIRTKYHQIFRFIIIPICINMMNSKNIFALIITTILTFFKHASANHIFSNCSKVCFPRKFAFFINARLGTIFTISAWRVIKSFMTMPAFVFNFIIVRCFSAYNGFKPYRFSVRLSNMPQTLFRACNGCFCPIWFNFISFTTMCTYQGDHNAF